MKNSNRMKNFKIISIHIAIIATFLAPSIIFGQVTGNTNPQNPPITINISNPLDCGRANNNDCTLMDLLTTILNKVVMPIAAIAVVVWIIWAGFQYVLAQGKPEAVTKAHQRLLWSLVGAGILLGAAGISSVVQNTINALIRNP